MYMHACRPPQRPWPLGPKLTLLEVGVAAEEEAAAGGEVAATASRRPSDAGPPPSFG